MDTKNLSGLLFLLGTASLAIPGCDDDGSDTGADTDTDGMTGTATASGTGSASDTTPTSDSDTTPTSDSDTTPTSDSDSDSDTTPTSDSDTTPTTATDGETETDGTTITATDTDGGTDTDTTTGVDTTGPSEACTGYATVYEDCYEGKQGYDYDMNVEFCETAIAGGASRSPECGEALEAVFGCISELSCKEFNAKDGKACAAENEASTAACGKE